MNDTEKYENFIQTVNWSVREEPAVKIFSVDLSQEIVDEVNEYIDNNTIPNNINYAENLASKLIQGNMGKHNYQYLCILVLTMAQL